MLGRSDFLLVAPGSIPAPGTWQHCQGRCVLDWGACWVLEESPLLGRRAGRGMCSGLFAMHRNHPDLFSNIVLLFISPRSRGL